MLKLLQYQKLILKKTEKSNSKGNPHIMNLNNYFEAQAKVDEALKSLTGQYGIQIVRRSISNLYIKSTSEYREIVMEYFVYKIETDFRYKPILNALCENLLVDWYRSVVKNVELTDDEIRLLRNIQRHFHRYSKLAGTAAPMQSLKFA